MSDKADEFATPEDVDTTIEGQTADIKKAAEAVYGEHLELADRYVQHLVTTGIEWGLLGPREVPRIWERHLLNCAVVEELIPEGVLVADVGSGAGLPGLALAIARPDSQFILIEPLERRVAWLDMVVADLGLENVDVIRARSEQVINTVDVDIVTARAVSALRTLLPLTAPLVHGAGQILALKGQSAQAEIDKAQKVLRKYKAQSVEVLRSGEDILETTTTVVRVLIG